MVISRRQYSDNYERTFRRNEKGKNHDDDRVGRDARVVAERLVDEARKGQAQQA